MSMTFDINSRSAAESFIQLSQSQKNEITAIILSNAGLELFSLEIQNFPSLISLHMPNGIKIPHLLLKRCQNIKDLEIPLYAKMGTVTLNDLSSLNGIQLQKGALVENLSLQNINSGLSFTFAPSAKVNKIIHYYKQEGQQRVYVEENINRSGTFDFPLY